MTWAPRLGIRKTGGEARFLTQNVTHVRNPKYPSLPSPKRSPTAPKDGWAASTPAPPGRAGSLPAHPCLWIRGALASAVPPAAAYCPLGWVPGEKHPTNSHPRPPGLVFWVAKVATSQHGVLRAKTATSLPGGGGGRGSFPSALSWWDTSRRWVRSQLRSTRETWTRWRESVEAHEGDEGAGASSV